LSCIDQCTVGQICTQTFPPKCSPLVNQSCMSSCLSLIQTPPPGTGPFGPPPTPPNTPPPPADYCSGTCNWEIPTCLDNPFDSSTTGSSSTASSCVAEECSSGCCCCDSLVVADIIKPRCYDRVTVSCNSDGTATGGPNSVPFPLSCDSCFEACDLIINDPNGCSKLSTLSWWDLGNTSCSCECKNLSVVDGCLLHCAYCGKCDAEITIQNSPCEYKLIVSPSSDCCTDNKKETVQIIFFNVGSYNNSVSGPDPLVKPEEILLFQQKLSELRTICTNNGINIYGDNGLQDGITKGRAFCDPGPCCPDAIYANETEAAAYIMGNLQAVEPPQRIEIVILVHGFISDSSQDACTDINWPGYPSDFFKCLETHNAKISTIEFNRNMTDSYFSSLPQNVGANENCGSGTMGYQNCRPSSFWPSDKVIGSIAAGPTEDQYDELWALITRQKPITSCDCIDSEPKVFTFDKKDCSPRTFDVCGTTIVIDTEDINMVCCEDIGCECSQPCCTPPPNSCACGTNCTEVCSNGTKLFPSLSAAIEAVWGECKSNAISEDDNGCIKVRMNSNIVQICKADIEAQVTAAWLECEECTGPDCGSCIGPDCPCPPGNSDCNGPCTGPDCPDCPEGDPDCNNCTGPDCNNCDGPDCPDCPPGDPDCNTCIGPDCDIPNGPGPDDDCIGTNCDGSGSNPPPNLVCTADETISPNDDCFSVRHPDVVVLNNGIGLVAFEDDSDPSVIKIKQFKTSIENKVQANRTLRFGRLQNPSKWIITQSGLYRVKLYLYENISNVQVGDGIFFFNGPLAKQAFILTTVSSDSTGDYLEFSINPTNGFEFSGSYESKTDDRYDVQWITYDQNDTGLIGDRPLPTGVEADLDATKEDVDSILILPPHYFDGKKVPVAYPRITNSDNYDNNSENSQFVYVAYQALENKTWRIYLRQLRLSEFKKSADVLLTSDNISSVTPENTNEIVWTCKSTCISYDCESETKIATITSVWTAATTEGIDIYNCDLRSGENFFCNQSFEKNKLTILVSQTTVSTEKCPTSKNLQKWNREDTVSTPVPEFISDTDQNEISNWANSHFNFGVTSSENVTINSLRCQLLYSQSQTGGWCTFKNEIIGTLNQYKGLYVSDPILISSPNQNSIHPKIKIDYLNRLFISYCEVSGNDQDIIVVGTNTPENVLPIGTDFRRKSDFLGFDSEFKFFYDKTDFTYRRRVTLGGLNQYPDMWIDLNNVVHIVWQSNVDLDWEIYYANSDDEFTPERITKQQSKSLRPSITGDNSGNLVIVWHDDRFGVWEIMAAVKPGSRIRPLYQQNEYIASMINNYQHTIDYVPFTITNDTDSVMCFTDLYVSFYQDRTLTIGPLLTVRKSDFPFAFSVVSSDPTYPSVPDKICLQPGESINLQMTLTPEIFTSGVISP